MCIRSLTACCDAMCRDVLCLCLCRERREGRHIPYFAVVYRTPREITAVDLLGNKIVTDITLYPYLDTFYPGKYLAVNRCLPACWRVDHRFLIEHLSYLIKQIPRRTLPNSTTSCSHSTASPTPCQTCEMSCPATAYRPGRLAWPWRRAGGAVHLLPCSDAGRGADVQATRAAALALIGAAHHGTDARAPLSRGDQRPGPGARCGVGDARVVRWGSWGRRPQAPAC